MILSLLLFFQEPVQITGAQELVRTVGFPAAVALMLLYFSYKVWQSQNNQIKDKDETLKTQIKEANEFRTKIVDSQNQIVNTQNNISRSFDSHLDTMTDIKNALQQTCKFK